MFHIAKAFSSISLPLTRTCAWFISSDQRKNRLLWSESYDFTPTRKPAMNFNHRHRKKVHYSRNISQPILMDPFFKVKRRIFFPRCRFLKLFKIHSNFSLVFVPFLLHVLIFSLPSHFYMSKMKKRRFPFLATVIFPAQSNLRNMEVKSSIGWFFSRLLCFWVSGSYLNGKCERD